MGISTPPANPSGRPAQRRKARSPQALPVGLAAALFTSTQQRVLALLYGQPERSFYATELIQRTGSGSGAVQRELHRLSASGLIHITRLGNQKHYQANAGAPIFGELRGIVDKTIGVAEVLRAALSRLESQIHFAALYGSLAKRTDGALSDIDVLIVARELTLEQSYAALAPAEMRLGRSVNPTLYSPEEYHQRRKTGHAFLRKVLAGPHIVLMGDELAAEVTR